MAFLPSQIKTPVIAKVILGIANKLVFPIT
jgi:hypothetical protein